MKTFVAFVISTLVSLAALAQSHLQSRDTGWKIVPNEMVCMVTERHFGFPQIPVKVEGKTYYGCCDNCKQTLTNGQQARTAVDPLSKKPIDKSIAIIAANNNGNVLYFENKKNFEKYLQSLKVLKR